MASNVQDKYFELVGKLREELKKSYEAAESDLDSGNYSSAATHLEKLKEITGALAAVTNAAEAIGL